MATLKDVASAADVPMLTAFHALKDDRTIDASVRHRVANEAKRLNYRLRITQAEIADLAGVAKGTVSYALNNSSLITEPTRLKVMEAARALGYKLNASARNLRTNQAGVIGYSWHVADDPSQMNNLLDRFIYRVTMAAEAHGFHLLTFIQPQANADRVYEDLITTSRVDGFIMSDIDYEDPRIARLTDIGAPFVAFGGMYLPDPQFAFVDVDGKMGMQLVVQHLIEQGHERIGMLNYNRGWPVSDAREAGYREAMKTAGIEVQPDWMAYTPNILHDSAEATSTLMSARHRPTAIACANDVMAFGAKTYFDGIGLRVGEDVALTGYDDDTTSEFLGITSVRQPIDEVAAAAFDILLGGINRKSTPDEQIVFEPALVVRRSSSIPR